MRYDDKIKKEAMGRVSKGQPRARVAEEMGRAYQTVYCGTKEIYQDNRGRGVLKKEDGENLKRNLGFKTI